MMGEWQVGSRAEGFDDFCARKCLEFPVNYCTAAVFLNYIGKYENVGKRGNMKRGGLAIIKIQMDGGGHLLPLFFFFFLLHKQGHYYYCAKKVKGEKEERRKQK